jgi:uncharacterized OB-fold protein
MEISRHWRLQPERLRLEGVRCTACAAVVFPRRPRCGRCGSEALAPHRLSGRGILHAVTEVVDAPRGFEGQVPYLVGLVRLDEGPVLTAQLTDVEPEDAVIGLELEVVTRRLREDGPDGLIHYGYKFRPRLAR